MNNNITIINIEKSILSSVLFNPNLVGDIVNLLQPSDFSHEPYKHIYATILQLFAEDYPIDETMIMQRNKSINHGVLVDILAANPVSNILSYVKELKKDSLTRQIHLITLSLSQNFDVKLIDKMQILKEELENVGGIKKLKTAESQNSFFEKMDMDFQKVEEARFEYLIDNFIVKNEITMIAARPATGKSLTAFAATNIMLSHNKVNAVFYLDGDNGITTIKERKIHHVKQKWGNKLRYIQGKSTGEYQRVIKELKSMDLSDCLVVFDSIKNFMMGGDRDKNRDVSKVMEVLKTLRNNGATVIFLHHSNKPQKDIDELMYAGSSAWEEDTANAFILKHNEDKKAFIFIPIKKRTGDLVEQAFAYDAENHWLHHLDLSFAKQTKEDEEITNEIIEFISNSRKEPTWSDIYNNLLELGFEKNKASKAIKDGENRLWTAKRGERNNQKLYSLIETATKPVEIVFEFEKNQKVTSGTPITSGSPFYGGFGVSSSKNTTTDNSDNSKIKSNFCEFDKIEMPKIAV